MNALTRFFLPAMLAAVSASTFAQQEDGAAAISVNGGQSILTLPLFPGNDGYRVFGSTDLSGGFGEITTGSSSNYTWTGSLPSSMGFYRVGSVPMPTNDTLAALVLSRLAYGPTPDELDRVKAMGANAYIAEQLAPENISETLDIDVVNATRDWRRVVVTGIPGNTLFYVYQTAPGDCYVDDLRIVPGTNPDGAGNLVVNGDFETALVTPWAVATNMVNSYIDTAEKISGASSLHLITTSPGDSQGTSISQNLPSLNTGGTYTLSFWSKPGTNINSNLVIRFSGNGISATSAGLSLATRLELGSATTDDLRAWHVLHAVRSKKQLQETLLQFLENHFVTQVTKTRDYFDRYYSNPVTDWVSARTEYQEIKRWRQALQSPTCTFSNLLTISTESPAQIIYLDTVNSRGDGSNIPNENYAREVLELYTFGVDNGYDQTDITLLSRAWTGWSVDIVDPTNEFNPLAPRSTTLKPGGTNVANIENLEGVWAFNYKANRHWNQGGTILFPGKKVPARFGAPYAGRDYTLGVDVNPNISTNWQRVTYTGTATASSLYMYLAGPGDIYLDDISIVAGTVAESGANLLANGGFESGLTGWTVSPNHAPSVAEAGGAHSGANALHMIATEGGSTRDSSIYRNASLVNGQTYTLSFWWRPGNAAGSSVTLRLSGSGLIATAPPRITGDGLAEGKKVVEHLSDLPFTQEFISVKLCRLFVHENFKHGVYDYTDPNLSAEGKLVRACMDAWENNMPKGQIRKVLEVIFNSELFRSQGAVAQKVKTPFEFTVSAVRALRSENANGTATANTDGFQIKNPIDRMGAMKLFDRAEPNGYPEDGAPWISAGTLGERLRWVQSFCIAPSAGGRGDAGANTVCDPVALLKKKMPSTDWNNAGAVADYFLSILLPGEGKANLLLYRQAAINFLNTDNNGTTPSQFSSLVNTAAAYDTRVRGMVAAIMTSQRFHEQ